MTPYRGSALPLIRLSTVLGIPGGRPGRGCTPSSSAPAPARWACSSIGSSGQREIVVRADRRSADPRRWRGRCDGSRRRTRGADPRCRRGCPRRPARGARTGRDGRGDCMSDNRSDHYILFIVAGTTYALPSHEVAHVEMVEQITRVPNAAGIRRRRRVLARPGRPGRQPARPLRIRARAGGPRTRLLVVQSGGRSVGLLVDECREFLTIPAGRDPSARRGAVRRSAPAISARHRDDRRPDDRGARISTNC